MTKNRYYILVLSEYIPFTYNTRIIFIKLIIIVEFSNLNHSLPLLPTDLEGSVWKATDGVTAGTKEGMSGDENEKVSVSHGHAIISLFRLPHPQREAMIHCVMIHFVPVL